MGPEDQFGAAAGDVVSTADKVAIPRQAASGERAAPRIPMPRGAQRRLLEVLPPVREEQVAPRRSRRFVSTALVVVADVVGLLAALLVADARTVAILFSVSMTVWFLTGLHARRFTLSVLDDLVRLAGGVLAGVAVLALATQGDPAGQWAAVLALLGSVIATRAAAYAVIRSRRASGHEVFPTLLVGSGIAARTIAERITEHPETGLRLEGWLRHDSWGEEPVDGPAKDVTVLGHARDLQRVVSTRTVSDVIVADTDTEATDLVDELRLWGRSETVVHAVPTLFEMRLVTRAYDEVWGVPLEVVRRPGGQRVARAAKRAMDILFAGGALVVLAPLLAVVALAVRREVGPNILFRQERVGQRGRLFDVLKFRSIPENVVAEFRWSALDESLLGPTGRFIRRYSLDEIPQLFNVLRGDMSLVGPRPERPRFVEEFELEVPGYRHRHRVPVGLTGLAAVKGLRGDTSLRDRAYFDNLYIENWSLWLDLKILVRTVGALVRGTGS